MQKLLDNCSLIHHKLKKVKITILIHIGRFYTNYNSEHKGKSDMTLTIDKLI